MSKDIWHRYDEAPKHQDIIMTDTGCWAYRADLLALETELEHTRKALDVAVGALKEIDNTRSPAQHKMTTANGKTLNSGIIFCWTTPDEIHNALAEITALEQKDK